MGVRHVDKLAVGALDLVNTLGVVRIWTRSVLGVPIVVAFLTACAPSTHVLVGRARPRITPDQVTIYSHPPATPFEEIATLDASSKSAFGTGGQRSVDKVIERLKIEAAKLGANGVILEGFSDAETGSIGTGVGSESYGNHSAVGVGVGGSLGIYKKTGRGDAIYVQPAGG
jgi:hypothetical protein